MRFLLDEDLPQKVAVIARRMGLDVLSVHEIDREGIADDVQLRFATSERRIFVSRNRDDFIELNKWFFARGELHLTVLIVPAGLPNRRPESIAHALRQWADRHVDEPEEATLYRVNFLSS